MNMIIKIAQVTALFISMNGISNASPPINKTDISSPSIRTVSCKIAPEQNACHTFMLHPGIDFPKSTGTLVVNQSYVNRKFPKKNEEYAFTIIAHPGGVSNFHGELENKGLASARFGLARVTHNKSLQIVDSEASNEHAQISLMIQMDSVPTIEKYVQFFSHSGYFTIAK